MYDTEKLGRMRVGDLLDAIIGYNEGESERVKAVAELVRTSTWLLWNTQVKTEDKAMAPENLWRFGWDKKEASLKIPEEEKKRVNDEQEKFLRNKHATNGDSNQ